MKLLECTAPKLSMVQSIIEDLNDTINQLDDQLTYIENEVDVDIANDEYIPENTYDRCNVRVDSLLWTIMDRCNTLKSKEFRDFIETPDGEELDHMVEEVINVNNSEVDRVREKMTKLKFA
jgi:hypothetical protein